MQSGFCLPARFLYDALDKADDIVGGGVNKLAGLLKTAANPVNTDNSSSTTEKPRILSSKFGAFRLSSL